MKKVLMALTNVDHYEGTDRETGVWLEEATNFYDIVTKAGYEVDFASAKGGAVPVDPGSLHADARTMKIYQSEDFRERALEKSEKFSEINPLDYTALFYAGGHGVMWDFVDNKELETIGETIYRNGGYIASVCHGEAGLLGLKDEDGDPLVKGKKINGFTNEEEKMNGTDMIIPVSPEDELKRLGAEFVKGEPFTEFAISDQRFITGQNPMSSRKVAELLVKEMA